jgi:hypothetical protein
VHQSVETNDIYIWTGDIDDDDAACAAGLLLAMMLSRLGDGKLYDEGS